MNRDEDELRRALQSAYNFGDDYPHPALPTRISAAIDSGVKGGRQLTWIAGVAATTLAALIVAVIGVRAFGHVVVPGPPAPTIHSSETGVAAILANNHLVYIPPGADRPKWDVAVAPPPNLTASHGYAGLGRRVASSADGTIIYALPAPEFVGGNTLVVVDSATGHVLHDVHLPNRGSSARYGALDVGPSGDIWIVGSVGPVPSESDLPFSRIEIVRVSHQDWSISSWLGRSMSQWVPQGPVGGEFEIYEVQVSSDETRVYYSYTGGLLSIAGLDWVDLAGNQATTCIPTTADKACIPGLAGFLVQGSNVYITTANDSPSGAIDFYSLGGVLQNHIELGLLPGFLEDFAVAPDGRSLYLFGSCGYSGGMARLDLSTQKSTVIVPAKSLYTRSANPPCGQSSVFVSSNLIALGHVGALLPADNEGRILYVDPVSGNVKRSVPVPSEPIAVTTAGAD